MILYSCINGSTVVDNYDESFLDTECELPTEVCDPTDDDLNAWSGFLSDMWDSDSTYERPSILFWFKVYALYAALALVLHLEVPSFPVVLLPFIFPQEEIVPKAD